ncbi:von Willebrand factor type A domain-containing protein [Lineolata rhizophorae]|uniref:von Willebrand factor type A domain-containing protein n=1 Tax=Lineolata rhizophorae TaxID=578093 RepID=A0A6A6P463_9PEZI|nr:von Willebrand factor type A domain-containing protein [Lineolata rhizophorae]
MLFQSHNRQNVERCGFYYISPCPSPFGSPKRTYLPQVALQSHTRVLSTASRTHLTQTFVNPSKDKGIKEVRYMFPLVDGVSVVGFSCKVEDRVIKGVVKEKEKARQDYQDAVASGQTAGLLEQLPDASDVFTTTIGNVPPGAALVAEITYLGELKHDAEVDGIRFTIPTAIAPRYGSYPGDLTQSDATPARGEAIKITVDAIMAENSFIKEMQSPSHPIAVSMGATSDVPDAHPQMHKASARLSLGEAGLDKDFVLQIVAKDSGVPKAILETHPTIPNQRALMTTLVPKFALPSEKPEIVFICDRSGSMNGKIETVISALEVFLKSLPVGVKFNICSFGSRHSFLWKTSKTYSQSSLNEAIRHVKRFKADYGGTEMLEPLRDTIKHRYSDMPLEVMLLTDGEIWNQAELFSHLNEQVLEAKQPIRVFTLGIGTFVSHALIEGIARSGNGFSQAVLEGEKLDSKVVRMLKGALSPHITDYTLEIQYGDDSTTDDDFDIVEKVSDCLKVNLNTTDDDKASKGKKPISLFDDSIDLDKKEQSPAVDHDGQGRYSHLPPLAPPKLLQAPHKIPPLFPFTRTTVYVLLSPETAQKKPKSALLRASSPHGPLELEVPIQVAETPSEMIHQLAAKKAVQDLEEGRGWITEARDESGQLVKEEMPGRFDEMVEREAVRLGVQFQVGGKWCSFVAVEANAPKPKDRDGDESMTEVEGFEFLDEEKDSAGAAGNSEAFGVPTGSARSRSRRGFSGMPILPPGSATSQAASGSGGGGVFGAIAAAGSSPFPQQARATPTGAPPSPPSGTPVSANFTVPPIKHAKRGKSKKALVGSLFGLGGGGSSFGGSSFASGSGLFQQFGSAQPVSSLLWPPDQMMQATEPQSVAILASAQQEMQGAPMRHSPKVARGFYDPTIENKDSSGEDEDEGEEKVKGNELMALIGLQTFEGSWELDKALLKIVGMNKDAAEAVCKKERLDKKLFATCLAVVFLRKKLAAEKDSWELVVDKAVGWLQMGFDAAANQKGFEKAEMLI